MLKQPKSDHVKAWAYTATALFATTQWELAMKVGSGRPDCQHGVLPGLPNHVPLLSPLIAQAAVRRRPQVSSQGTSSAQMRPCLPDHDPSVQNVHRTSINCPVNAWPCSGLWLNLSPGACPQACHLAVSIDVESPTAVKLLGALEKVQKRAGLGVSQAPTTKQEIQKEQLKRHPAVARSRHSATVTCPGAVCARGGSRWATQPEAQPLEGLQQAVYEPISGPETSRTQKVRQPAALV